MDKTVPQSFDLARALSEAYPELRQIAVAAGDTPIYVVGGAIRDLFAGRGRSDLDLAVEGDPEAVIAGLGGEPPVSHDRFQTATVDVDGLRVDLARTRRERYLRPGALPEVKPASIAEDLARRDFTVNAMAVRVGVEGEPWPLLDPFGGCDDLAAGRLRLLHPDSIRDDPTRALRGARYAASYGLAPDAATAAQLERTDLGTVSLTRLRADLARIAADPARVEAFELLERWRVARLREGWRERLAAIERLLAAPPWQGSVDFVEAALAAVWPASLREGAREEEEAGGGGGIAGGAEPQGAQGEAAAFVAPAPAPATAAEIVAWAKPRSPLELLLARAEGAAWLDDYMARLRHIELEIDGGDLLAAGVPEGPAIGHGLAAALTAKLNGELAGREAELAAALAAARAYGEGR